MRSLSLLLAVPDVKKKLASGQDYFSIPENEMFFDQNEYDKMSQVIQDSGQQMVTTEVVFVKPQIRKYSMDINIRYFEGFSRKKCKGIYRRLQQGIISSRTISRKNN